MFSDADFFIRKGVEYVNAQLFDKALNCFNNAIELEPKNRYGWQSKGFMLCNMNRWQEAALCFDRMIELDPRNPEPWAWKGDALLGMQMYPEAIACFNQAIDLDQDWDFPLQAKQFALEQQNRRSCSNPTPNK